MSASTGSITASRTIGDALRHEGKRLTPQRKLVLQIITASDEHLDAEAIYRQARESGERGARMSLATVYRTLHVLTEMGLLRELHLDQTHHHYETAQAEHYHLTCVQCGAVQEHWPADGGRHLRRLAAQCGFELTSANLELYGLCQACRDKAARTPSPLVPAAGEQREEG